MRPSILVVDDERRYRELLEMNLTRRGYRVRQAEDGLSALNAVEEEEPSLVVLDLKLPDIDGYEVCRRLRSYSKVPIIMLTARAEQDEKVRGLGVGADDYVTKPFGAEELLARVDAVLRRTRSERPGQLPAFETGELRVDFAEHRVTLRGGEIELSPGEYRLLAELAANAGRVLLQDELLVRVWGPGYPGATALLQTAVRRLRRKIEDDAASPRYILTRRGIGYLLARS
jgi:DNA-binding response OmpR family regulator